MISTDVIIIGAGPAGASAARRLKEAGVDLLLLDEALFPRNKSCAGWIPTETFTHLGIAPEEYPHSLVHQERFRVKWRGIPHSLNRSHYSIRRYEFDHWLLKMAGSEPTHHRVRHVREEENHFVVDDMYRARYIIGAGGSRCPLYRSLFRSSVRHPGEFQFLTRQAEFPAEKSDKASRLWLFPEQFPGYAWYIPKGNGYVNIGLNVYTKRVRNPARHLNAHWERLVERLNHHSILHGESFKPRGHTYYAHHSPGHYRSGNAFLVGDAAALATRDLGEGISNALRSGILAADSILSGERYLPDTLPRLSLGDALPGRLLERAMLGSEALRNESSHTRS